MRGPSGRELSAAPAPLLPRPAGCPHVPESCPPGSVAASGSGLGGASGSGGRVLSLGSRGLPSRRGGDGAPAVWVRPGPGRAVGPRASSRQPGPRRGRRAFQSQAASGAAALAGGNNSAPTRLRIARNWVTLPESSGHSLQPLTVISFLPDICPFKGGQAGSRHIFRRSRGAGVGRRVRYRVGPAPPPRQAGHSRPPAAHPLLHRPAGQPTGLCTPACSLACLARPPESP